MPKRALLIALMMMAAAIGAPARAADPYLQEAVLQEVNAIRRWAGLPPVRLDPRLSRAAELHSRDMLRTNQLTHRGSDGSDPGLRMTRAGYRWRSYRENVGAGYFDVRQVMAGWMNSPDHRDNILAADVTQIGVGYAAGPGMMAGNIPRQFWTLVFAAPR